MKIKIAEKEAMHLSGVVLYGELKHQAYSSTLSGVKNLGYQKDEKQMHNFEGAINKFGDLVESFGRHLEQNAKKWEESALEWTKNFEFKAEEFGDKMEAWGEQFEKKMELWGEQLEKAWEGSSEWSEAAVKKEEGIMEYAIYTTYEQLFEKHLKNHPNLMKKNHFYEVRIMDSGLNDHEAMVLLGNRFQDGANVTYPSASMTFDPDKWLVIKLTEDEFAKDWLKRLEDVELIKDYIIEPYFIITHPREKEDEWIRIRCPLGVRADA
ncbi:MAG: hypothetical protein CVU95_15525 [Firmicutes bacterium HGW-Firmicutes-2]|jgi:hypothetical protein|nr:MAG: hypothetical protein CVU95_15525 [Firmicutes bacterium HGW-Firmicutes-2]